MIELVSERLPNRYIFLLITYYIHHTLLLIHASYYLMSSIKSTLYFNQKYELSIYQISCISVKQFMHKPRTNILSNFHHFSEIRTGF